MTITGTAAGVPFTALPPATDGPAPLVVSWHMLDAPRTDAAFAAALPMAGVPAWRVHLGMPMCGARMVDGSLDAIIALARQDPLLNFMAPFVNQAAAEFPAALAALREQLPVDGGSVHLLGASLGGAVALEVLTGGAVPVRSAALVNPAVRIRSAIGMVAGLAGREYAWSAESDAVAAALDFVARAGEIGEASPLLIVSGEHDDANLRADAAELVAALRSRRLRADVVTVEGLGHALADEPGLEPAPPSPAARAVDAVLTEWFSEQVTGDAIT
ncbi:alpha/beta hydrolase family protein [Actinokineospora guangxiensis]|uniref:Alpha/beta hydrolase family protein n=1 Tax=Actinokineospora guangxiensis TaxID=1490288 RepID=A0ABW0EN23_9PSEU